MDEFEDQVKNKYEGQRLIDFKPKVGLNEWATAIIKWLTIIVKKSLSISYVDDDDMRNFAECKCPVSTKTLRGVLLSLVELVEYKIRMKWNKKGMSFAWWVV